MTTPKRKSQKRRAVAHVALTPMQANRSLLLSWPEIDAIGEAYDRAMPFSTGEWEKIHVLNGMAWRMRDEFVSERTARLLEAAQDAARRFGYGDRLYKDFAKSAEASKRGDIVRALAFIRR